MKRSIALACVALAAPTIVAIGAAVLVGANDRPYVPPSLAIDASTDEIVSAYQVRVVEAPDGAPSWVTDLRCHRGHQIFVLGSATDLSSGTPFLVVRRDSVIFNGEPIPVAPLDHDSLVLRALVGALVDWFQRAAEAGAESTELRILVDIDASAALRAAVACSVERAGVHEAWFLGRGADGYEAFQVRTGVH